MDLLLILSIAIGLSMDAMAVAAATGAAKRNLPVQWTLLMACFFGVFQALMPILGWLAGTTIRNTIAAFDHWLAFALLLFIGIKMIYESARDHKHQEIKTSLTFSLLLMMAVATSIDAFAVGLSLSLLHTAILIPAMIIGITTFALSFISVFVGKRLGHIFGKRMEMVGGLILIAIGIKILLEHL